MPDNNGPTWQELDEYDEVAARELYQVPQRYVLGFDGSRPGVEPVMAAVLADGSLRVEYSRWLPEPRPLHDCEDTPIFEAMLIEGWHPDLDFMQRFLLAMRPTLNAVAEVCAAFIDGCSPELLLLAGIEPPQ